MASVTKYYQVRGKVQNVMFRQTFIRGAQKRDLAAGATNDSMFSDRVFFILHGKESEIDEYVEKLKEVKVLNSWGATIEELTEVEPGGDLNSFQVTTENVDKFNWNPDVEMYI